MSPIRRPQFVKVEGRPNPSSDDISRIRGLMGQGEDGVWTATQFEAPSNSSGVELTPDEVIQAARTNTSDRELSKKRFCIDARLVPNVVGAYTMFIYTDGACSDNGSDTVEPKGGVGFVISNGEGGKVGFALEKKGPDGEAHRHTSNRAELRAVTAALAFRVWPSEGWERVVIVTDSEYVANHATGSLRKWAGRGWKLASGKPVANIDLWRELSEIMRSYANRGCEISFWRVPRQHNAVADQLAKEMAAAGNSHDEHIKCFCSNRPSNVVFR